MKMASDPAGGWLPKTWAIIGGGAVALVGAVLLAGGGMLVFVNGSPYYLMAGAALVATGLMLALRRPSAGLVYAATLAATLGWALWEAGLNFWPLLPRLLAPAVLGLFILLVMPVTRGGNGLRRWSMWTLGFASVADMAVLGMTIPATFTWGQAKTPAAVIGQAASAEAASDWRFYGGDPGGARHAPAEQINRDNLGQLRVAWTFRTGEATRVYAEDQNTPMQAGDALYVCTPTSVVIAVDPDTGQEKWRHDPKARPHTWNRCRGVGYWDGSQPRVALGGQTQAAALKVSAPGPAAAAPPGSICRRRVISATINAQLFALDAETGQPCPEFGRNGLVNLAEGMGELPAGYYFQTSTPTVVGDLVIIGGFVMDNKRVAAPSGVVRAFSVITGELQWAWDLGNPQTSKLPPDGQAYTSGTPNVWSTPAFDPDLGLLYLPTGNSTPDYWGSHRSKASEAYSSSVVALDIATGKERWKFQTVHHDVWDYDVASQPMLIDFPTPAGPAPALVQFTKRGQIFVLDRRTGKPLTRVLERPAPQGAAPGEWLSPTQPYSVDMPAIGAERLTEKAMWGATPFDQLYCRILFRSRRYDGDFTPPSTQGSVQFPANTGGMNWGSGAFDPRRGLLIVNDTRLPQIVKLSRSNLPEFNPEVVKDRPAQSLKAVPYQTDTNWMMSPAGAPCLQPPHGMLTAIDVRTRDIVWQVPTGTAEALGLFGTDSNLPIPIGNLGVGGQITTGGGLTFRAATLDPYLRAYDNASGKELWRSRLPAATAATPMSYVSPKTGKQYVVISDGGSRAARPHAPAGDYVIAYALSPAPKGPPAAR
jgi:quinate dehydrogenase (quinone)